MNQDNPLAQLLTEIDPSLYANAKAEMNLTRRERRALAAQERRVIKKLKP